MRVLVACEFSGIVRDAFIKKGHKAMSCDLLDTESPGPHLTADVLKLLQTYHFDLMVAHPPCTYLSVSGLHWNTRIEGRKEKTEEALEFVEALWRAPVEKICIENPVGCLSTMSSLGKPTQIIQPHDFGDDASKKTCLWLKNLEPLVGTKYVEPRIISGKKRWSNQTDSGQNVLGPSEHRAKDRSRTYQGIADQMAATWG